MDADAKKEIEALIGEVDSILADFESGMRELTQRQRAAISKAAGAVDGKRLEKVKKLIDTLYA
jgi:vacuolar-type H+-ATPase subunit E/Vma4